MSDNKCFFDEHGYSLSTAIKLVELSGKYQVHRRIDTLPSIVVDSGDEVLKTGVVLDLETTGLNQQTEKIIEIGLVPFSYGADTGKILSVGEPVSYFEDPGQELDDNIVKLTGITNEMVKGHQIDDNIVSKMFIEANIIIAHNASFDRPFVDKRFDFTAINSKPWACSFREIPWEDYGFRCTKLECLLSRKCSTFFDGHRAVNDCMALLQLLGTPFYNGILPMKTLIESARKKTIRIWATGAHYDLKDVLKERSYYWNDGTNGEPKAWWKDISESEKDRELEWLRKFIYGGVDGLWTLKIFNAWSRYRA